VFKRPYFMLECGLQKYDSGHVAILRFNIVLLFMGTKERRFCN
jgi:hypothetical protein